MYNQETLSKEFIRSKIYKSATKRSIMDITSALNIFQEKNGESQYKGKVVFSITEIGKPSKYAKAFVSKHAIKPVLHLIMNHQFPRFYTDGFTSYGGSK